MRKLSLIAGFSLLILLAATPTAEAGSRFAFSFGIGAPVYAPYAYYPAYPPYPVAYPPYYYYSPYYPAPVVTFYGGARYGYRVYGRNYPMRGYYRGHVPPGHAYGRYRSRPYRGR